MTEPGHDLVDHDLQVMIARKGVARKGVARSRVGVLAAATVLVGALSAQPNLSAPWRGAGVILALLGIAWLAYAVGAYLVCRLPRREAVALILAVGVATQVVAFAGPPRSSDDLYRYLWDGRVQAAGINPYRYAPAAPELVGLRDERLWPQVSNWCVPESVDSAGGCTLVNRPTVHTIYPPVAQVIFLALELATPAGSGVPAAKLLASLFALATTVLLLVGLRRRGGDPRRAVLWAWCPAVAIEAASNAHIDVVAVFLTGLALLVLAGARTRTGAGVGGVLLGLAVAVKVTPVLVAPAVTRRRPVTVAVAAAGTVALVYLPHVVAVGASVLGYLPGYLREEGYADGGRFALLTTVVSPGIGPVTAMAVLAAAALWVILRADPDQPWVAATTMVGVALLVAAPAYPWYALLLVLLVALGGRAWWLPVAAAGYLVQYAPDLALPTQTAARLAYGGAAAVVLVAVLARRFVPRLARRSPPRSRRSW